jgi:hypothetical protein
MMHKRRSPPSGAVDTISVATLAREVGLSPGELHFQMPLIAGHGYTPSRRRPTRRWSHARQRALDEMQRNGRLRQLRQRATGPSDADRRPAAGAWTARCNTPAAFCLKSITA